MTADDRPARLHHRHRRRRPTGPDAGDGGGATRLSLPRLRARCRQRRRRRSPRDFTQGAFDDEGALDPLRRRGRRRHLRVREYPDRRRSPRSPSWCRSTRRSRAGDRAGPARGEELHPAPRRPARAVRARSTTAPGSTPRWPRSARPAILKTRRFGYDGKGQVRIDAPAEADAAWDDVRGAPSRPRRPGPLRRRILDPALPRRATARSSTWDGAAQPPRGRHPRHLDACPPAPALAARDRRGRGAGRAASPTRSTMSA